MKGKKGSTQMKAKTCDIEGPGFPVTCYWTSDCVNDG